LPTWMLVKDVTHRMKVGKHGTLTETYRHLRMYVITGSWLGWSLSRKSKKMLRKCDGKLIAS